MKKRSFYFLAVLLTAIVTSCANDGSEGGVGGSCSMEGNWKVKSAEITCDKIDSTLLKLTKESALKYEYLFSADSVRVKTNGLFGDYVGSYQLDASTNTLTMKTLNNTSGKVFNYNLKVLGCNENIITVSSSTPVDTAGTIIMQSNMVLEKTK